MARANQMILALFLFLPASSGFSVLAADLTLPFDPAGSWASTYLINSVFALEYKAILEQDGLDKDSRSRFFTTKPSFLLWKRAYFALAAAKHSSQRIPGLKQLKGFMVQHQRSLETNPEFADALKTFLERAPDNGSLPAVIDDIDATFTTATYRAYWNNLKSTYGAPSPSCRIAYEDVRKFTTHQKNLTAGGGTPNASELLEPIRSWNLAKIQCLLFAMIASPEKSKIEEGFDPVHLLWALQQSSSSLAKDNTVRIVHAIRLLQLGQYAETLRILVGLQDRDPSIRLPYEIVQRIYSIRQKGQGAVALRGL